MCGLQAFSNVIAGSLGVEQKKRLTIAVELAAKVGLLSTDSFSDLCPSLAEAPVVSG